MNPSNSKCRLTKNAVNHGLIIEQMGFHINSMQMAAVHLSAKGRTCAQMGYLGYHPEASLVLSTNEKCMKENIYCANCKQQY